MLSSSGFAAAAGALAPNAASVAETPPVPETPETSTLASSSAVVSAGQTIDLPVAMPASQTNGTFLLRYAADPSASLTFAVLRPGGEPVAPTDADVTYESGDGFGGLTETRYVLANAAPGTWTMRVTGTTAPPTGWPYDMQALVPGGISVAASTGADQYDVGQPIALTAHIAVNDVPFGGASVNALVTKPDNTTAAVPLTDVGGGTYTANFGNTGGCGLYQVTITATGSDGATPFSRQDRTLAFVGVPGNVIGDPCIADSDGDGLTDKEGIDAYNTNPASADSDSDGLTDEEEVNGNTDPASPDTDGDGISDGSLGFDDPPAIAPG